MAVVATDPIGGVIPAPPPPEPPLPGILPGGASMDAEVRLVTTFNVPLTITLTSSYPTVAAAEPSTVTIPAGESARRIQLVSNEVTEVTSVTIAGYTSRGILTPYTLAILPTDTDLVVS